MRDRYSRERGGVQRFLLARDRVGPRPRFGRGRGREETDAGYANVFEDAVALLLPTYWQKGWYVVEERRETPEGPWRRVAIWRPLEIVDDELKFRHEPQAEPAEPVEVAASG